MPPKPNPILVTKREHPRLRDSSVADTYVLERCKDIGESRRALEGIVKVLHSAGHKTTIDLAVVGLLGIVAELEKNDRDIMEILHRQGMLRPNFRAVRECAGGPPRHGRSGKGVRR